MGQYTRVQQFANVPSSNLTYVIQRVTSPVLGDIQDDKVRLKEEYRKVIRITMFITFILMLGLCSIAKPMVIVFIGEKMAAECTLSTLAEVISLEGTTLIFIDVDEETFNVNPKDLEEKINKVIVPAFLS